MGRYTSLLARYEADVETSSSTKSSQQQRQLHRRGRQLQRWHQLRRAQCQDRQRSVASATVGTAAVSAAALLAGTAAHTAAARAPATVAAPAALAHRTQLKEEKTLKWQLQQRQQQRQQHGRERRVAARESVVSAAAKDNS
jgi:hypothetical protein